jgi:hypothetical protein
VVAGIGDPEIAFRIDRDRCGPVEFPIFEAAAAERTQIFAGFAELLNAVVVLVDDPGIAFCVDRDVGG